MLKEEGGWLVIMPLGKDGWVCSITKPQDFGKNKEASAIKKTYESFIQFLVQAQEGRIESIEPEVDLVGLQ